MSKHPGKHKVRSKDQAGFLGAIIAGKARKSGLSKVDAKKKVRGVKVGNLPKRTKKK